ncbi:hypothetical protein AAF712_009139 [Marasmius tenuissimus]|uniref:Glycoside hydrolase family 76 protein n=1 Tax=Marasmius tenuissimus TaxID=585030 RepID=A0ABR2ZS04_9AGAR
MYGLAAMQAYAAYKDRAYLGYAETAWGSVRVYTLSDNEIRNGKSAVKSITLQNECDGASLAGDKNNDRLNGLSTGNFLILSALLAEATGNQTYLIAATQSLDFFRSQLYDDQSGLVRDYLSAVTYWYTIHALSTLYKRNISDAALQKSIHDYLAIQYNVALNSYTDLRAMQDPKKQTVALAHLVSGIILEDDTTNRATATPPVASPTTSPTEVSQRLNDTDSAIAGAAGGGIVFLVLTGIGIWLLRRRYRRQVVARKLEQQSVNPVVPYPVDHRPVMLESRNSGHNVMKWYDEIPHPSKKQQMIAERERNEQSYTRLSHCRDSLPTEQLIRMLQARLQRTRNEVEDISPPEYTSTLGSK